MYVYGGVERGLSAVNVKLTKLILQIEYPSFLSFLISLKKWALIQNSLPQMPSAFNKHGIAKKIRKIWQKWLQQQQLKKIQKRTISSAILN